MNRWFFLRFQAYYKLDINIVIKREILINIKKDHEREFIKVGKLIFKNLFAVQILLVSVKKYFIYKNCTIISDR